MVAILMMSAKLATLGRLIIKLLWNKSYDVLLFVHDIANQISSSDSNYVVDAVMWPKFGSSTISKTEVIITSIL